MEATDLENKGKILCGINFFVLLQFTLSWHSFVGINSLLLALALPKKWTSNRMPFSRFHGALCYFHWPETRACSLVGLKLSSKEGGGYLTNINSSLIQLKHPWISQQIAWKNSKGIGDGILGPGIFILPSYRYFYTCPLQDGKSDANFSLAWFIYQKKINH